MDMVARRGCRPWLEKHGARYHAHARRWMEGGARWVGWGFEVGPQQRVPHKGSAAAASCGGFGVLAGYGLAEQRWC
jgi:hypothetical protein